MTAALQARAVPNAALAADGRGLIERMFGDTDTYLEHERWQRPLLRRAITSPFILSADDIWAMIDAEILDVSNAEFRLVRATETGFDAAPSGRYAVWRETTDGKALIPQPEAVRDLVAQGYSIAAQLLDRRDPTLGGACAALSAWTGHPTQVSAYLSPAAGGALQVHHDTHDVVILQGAGRKTYDLFDPVIDRPIPTVHLDPLELAGVAPRATVTLEPGDMLYLPRGIPHRAQSGADGSLHLTVGFLSITWSSLMRSLADDLVYVADLRDALTAGEIFDGAALAFAADAAAQALAAWVRTEGGPRLAALAAQSLLTSFALRDPADPLAPEGCAMVAIDPSPCGGATLRSPTSAERFAPGDPELQAWFQAYPETDATATQIPSRDTV